MSAQTSALGSRQPLASRPGRPKITLAQEGDRHWGYFWQTAQAYCRRVTSLNQGWGGDPWSQSPSLAWSLPISHFSRNTASPTLLLTEGTGHPPGRPCWWAGPPEGGSLGSQGQVCQSPRGTPRRGGPRRHRLVRLAGLPKAMHLRGVDPFNVDIHGPSSHTYKALGEAPC